MIIHSQHSPMSQTYEPKQVLTGICWNSNTEYATASFCAPSGYQEIFVAVRFVSFGSLKKMSKLKIAK